MGWLARGSKKGEVYYWEELRSFLGSETPGLFGLFERHLDAGWRMHLLYNPISKTCESSISGKYASVRIKLECPALAADLEMSP